MEDIAVIVRILNDMRRKSKDKWYFYRNKTLKIDFQAFNTYIHIFRINGVNYKSGHGMKVKEFTEYITEALENGLYGKTTSRFASY